MDPAQPVQPPPPPSDGNASGDIFNYSDIPANKSSYHKKIFLVIGVVGILLLGFSSLLFLSASNGGKKTVLKPSPTPRPTATPFVAPTMPVGNQIPSPEVSPAISKPPDTTSPTAIPSEKPVGRLIFIKDGDIYQSDFASYSLLVKNTTPAGSMLSWSGEGGKIVWAPKSVEATPSSLVVYDRKTGGYSQFRPGGTGRTEVIDYSISPDDNQIAVLYRDVLYKIAVYSLSSPNAAPVAVLEKGSILRKIFWLDQTTLLFAGDEGIASVNPAASGSAKTLFDKQVQYMGISRDKTMVVAGSGEGKKCNLYILGSDGSSLRMLPLVPPSTDMGDTKLTQSVLGNGFVCTALFFPSGDKLLVGYHYLPGLPLSGVYDLKANAFKAVSPFIIYPSDIMIDDFRLVGNRVNNTGKNYTWNLSIFTLEDNAKFGTIRVIPEAYSPAFIFK